MRQLVTITDWISNDDTEGLCQTRIVGGEGMAKDLVEGLMYWELQKDLGYRNIRTLATEGWTSNPDGPVWHDAKNDPTIDPCWTLDWQRIDE